MDKVLVAKLVSLLVLLVAVYFSVKGYKKQGNNIFLSRVKKGIFGLHFYTYLGEFLLLGFYMFWAKQILLNPQPFIYVSISFIMVFLTEYVIGKLTFSRR